VTGVGSTDDPGYPGDRLGLPERGPGSVARFAPRLLALDWVACVILVLSFGLDPLYGPPRDSLVALAVLVVEHTILVGLLGNSLGHRLVGIRVARLDGAPIGLPRGLARAVLLVLVIPPLVMDRDARGLHDFAAGTAVLRR
jgi:uncharacterized RDD family membrane protein YckC